MEIRIIGLGRMGGGTTKRAGPHRSEPGCWLRCAKALAGTPNKG